MSPREHRASLRRDLQEGSYCAQFKTYHDEMKENEDEEPPVTEAELARVLELDAKATQGPWFYCASLSPEETGRPNGVCCDVRRDTEEPHGGDYEIPSESIIDELRDEDMELIAEYRTLTPRLARELASARAAIKVAREAIEWVLDKDRAACVTLKELGVPLEAESYEAQERLSAALAQLNTHTHDA